MRVQRTYRFLLLSVALSACMSVSACFGTAGSGLDRAASASGSALPGVSTPADGNTNSVPAVPFAAVGPEVYVNKVKTLINGLPPTADEMTQVVKDPTTLPALIDTWMASDNFRQKQIDFFKVAFQQQNLSLTSLDVQASDGFGMYNRIPNYQNAMESFPRTAWNIVAQDQPFNTTMTTDTFMVTPAYLSTLLYFDQRAANDNGSIIGINYDQGARSTIEQGSSEDPMASSAQLDKGQTSIWYAPCGTAPFATNDESGLLMRPLPVGPDHRLHR